MAYSHSRTPRARAAAGVAALALSMPWLACGGRSVTIGSDGESLRPCDSDSGPCAPSDASGPSHDTFAWDGGALGALSCYAKGTSCGCSGRSGTRYPSGDKYLATQCHDGICGCIRGPAAPLPFAEPDACGNRDKLVAAFAQCHFRGEPAPPADSQDRGCYGTGTSICGCSNGTSDGWHILLCVDGNCTCTTTDEQKGGYLSDDVCSSPQKIVDGYSICW